jgi:hypothetical protein
MKWIPNWLALSLLTSFAIGYVGAEPTMAASRMQFDNQCITIDGKDLVIFSGAFHYFRCPRELWADRFRKLKEAGFNTVETYSAWNWHEQSPPADPEDYSKINMSELNDWLAMATDQFGLNVVLRPGPYICAEWDGGGYPQWLMTKRPADFKGKEWLRGDDKTYLAWCKHWFTAVAKVAVPYQITHRPAGKAGIILWQIENEYDYSDQPIDIKHNQLLFLAHISRDLGIDVPLTTCMTSDSVYQKDEYLKQNVVETRNTYPKFQMSSMQHNIGMLDQYQPDKFKMVTELQGGWFAEVGGKLSEAQGFDASHINHVTLYAWEHGFTATNYYMGFGGTNFGDWAAANITTTYDYDAPVRECGGITQRYLAVKALGNFIAEHGARLARSRTEPVEREGASDPGIIVSLRHASDDSRYLFVRTEQRSAVKPGTLKVITGGPNSAELTVNYDLGPFGSKILYLPAGATSDKDGQWYPKAVEGPKRPSELPASVKISEARMQVDSGPTKWTPVESGEGVETAGIFNRGFVFYRAAIPQSTQKLVFSVHPSGHDWAGFTLNGKRLVPDANSGGFTLDGSSAGGELLGLYENYGRANGGRDMERVSGLTDQKINQTWGEPVPLTQWRMKRIQNTKRPAEMSIETDDSKWASADVSHDEGELTPGESAVYRTWVNITDDNLKNGKALGLGRVDDEGTVQINGKQVGQSYDWSVPQRFDIAQSLHAGKNLIAVMVRNRDGTGGLARGAWLDSTGPALPVRWEVSDQSAGVASKWWNADLDDSAWQTEKIDGQSSSASPPASLLSWYRLKFELPENDPHKWVPWKVHLDVVGNGFLYLNGHALGRWWQVGPQRDFYLPECWLNFGPGKTNVIALTLRPTDGLAIRSAEVGPYPNLAEER